MERSDIEAQTSTNLASNHSALATLPTEHFKLANLMPHFVRLFKPQFADLVASGQKCQTVRPIPTRMPVAGDTISCRTWSDKPYRSKQRLLAEGTITQVSPITITEDRIFLNPRQRLTVHPNKEEFAISDGFKSWPDMRAWFEKQHSLPFTGILIRWKLAN